MNNICKLIRPVAGLLILYATLQALPASATEAVSAPIPASTQSTEAIVRPSNKLSRERVATGKSAPVVSNTYVSPVRDDHLGNVDADCSYWWCGNHFVLILGVAY
jgi:hypothetical protein